MYALLMLFYPPSFSLAETSFLYTLNDLAVLAREKNFEEFLAHMHDIRPSQRQGQWNTMCQAMGQELVDDKLKSGDYTEKSFKYIEGLSRSSALQNAELFQLKRTAYAKKFLSACYSSAKEGASKLETAKACDNHLNTFWSFSRKDPEVGLALAQLIEDNQRPLPTWSFYDRALKDSVASIYCQQTRVQRAVIKKLTQESFDPDFDGHYKNLINRFVPAPCFVHIVEPLRLALSSPLTTGLDKEMALNLLSASGKMTAEEEDLYAIFYLLDGPVVGDKMNLAWKKVETLGEQYKKREALLERLKKMETLPDKIFKDPTLPRHKAIINLFAKNFPEYLNYYGESCLQGLKAPRETSAPTSASHQCHKFLKAAGVVKKAEATSWVNDTIQTRYSGLKK